MIARSAGNESSTARVVQCRAASRTGNPARARPNGRGNTRTTRYIARMSTHTIFFPANQADIDVESSARQASRTWIAGRPKLRTQRSSIVQTMTRGRSHSVSVEIRRRRSVKGAPPK